jgi:hypothetical protein
VQHFPDDLGLYQLLDFFDDEVLSVLGLTTYLLLDGARARTHRQVMLNHLLGNPGEIGWFLSKHIKILPKEGDDRAFLFGESLEPMVMEWVMSPFSGTFLVSWASHFSYFFLGVEPTPTLPPGRGFAEARAFFARGAGSELPDSSSSVLSGVADAIALNICLTQNMASLVSVLMVSTPHDAGILSVLYV